MSTENPLLELCDVTHQRGGVPVLEQVDWTVGVGERWALLGPCGAGKTTLLRLACGREWPNRGGTVRREGSTRQNLNEWSNRVGWLSQDLLGDIPPSQSVLATVLTGVHAQTRLMVRRDRSLEETHERRAGEWLDRVNLGNRRGDRFGNLSQGEKQLVLVARALVADPDLVVLDEPCAGLDPGARERFLADLQPLLRREDERSYVYVTHRIEEILPEIDRVLALREGRILARGSREETLTETTLERLYDTPHRLRRSNGRYWPILPGRTS